MNKLTPGSNMIWESSRMMLPEHIKALKEYKKETAKISKSDLDSQEKLIINGKIKMASISVLTIDITYFNEGTIRKVKGKIKKVDEINKTLTLRGPEEVEIKMDDLLEIVIL